MCHTSLAALTIYVHYALRPPPRLAQFCLGNLSKAFYQVLVLSLHNGEQAISFIFSVIRRLGFSVHSIHIQPFDAVADAGFFPLCHLIAFRINLLQLSNSRGNPEPPAQNRNCGHYPCKTELWTRVPDTRSAAYGASSASFHRRKRSGSVGSPSHESTSRPLIQRIPFCL